KRRHPSDDLDRSIQVNHVRKEKESNDSKKALTAASQIPTSASLYPNRAMTTFRTLSSRFFPPSLIWSSSNGSSSLFKISSSPAIQASSTSLMKLVLRAHMVFITGLP